MSKKQNTRPQFKIVIFIILLFLFILPAFIYYLRVIIDQQRWDDEQLLKTVTQLHRGTPSERDMVLKLLKSGIPAQTIFHDLYVKTSNDNFSQIDLVIMTKVGIIVVEVKDYSGWIFGNENQTNWTQVLSYGKEKYYFYNPVKQNSAHVYNLKKLLHKEQVPFYSLICFYGGCQLKNVSVSKQTYLCYAEQAIDVVNSIIKNNPPAVYKGAKQITELLKNAVENGDDINNINRHIKNIRDMKGQSE
jgi:hypothetical protein